MAQSTSYAGHDDSFATEPGAICVYCGSKPGAAPRHLELARAIGVEIGSQGLRLVYGAGDLGLMGAVAAACRAAGGQTLGVIPERLFQREVTERRRADVIVTETLHQRKALMLANADAAIVLPGGVGTLDEFIEAATWRHLGLHAKPVILLDPDDYWAPLTRMFARMAEEGFLWASFAPLDSGDPSASADGAAFEVARSAEDAVARIRRAWRAAAEA